MKELKKEYCNEPGMLMDMSRLENVSSISSFSDSMVDWLDILLLPNNDLQNNDGYTYQVNVCGNPCPNGLHRRTKAFKTYGYKSYLLPYHLIAISFINKSYI